jgi:spore protease
MRVEGRRTDLAVEAREIWSESAQQQTELSGVEAREYRREGLPVTHVRILDERGVQALGKPVGSYVTLELDELRRHEDGAFRRAAAALSAELRPLLPEGGRTALVVGLGNRAITPDAVGPLCMENILVTRHLVEQLPDAFGHLRPVAALTPGVLGGTGLESAEIIRGVMARCRPAVVVMVDALASRKLSRLCRTVQLSDTGIVPGSGVGNARAAMNRETLGVPVVAVGVPTVVDAATLASDLLADAGLPEPDGDALRTAGGGMIVTPKEIDSQVQDVAKVIAYAVNLALHPKLDMDALIGYLS